MTPPNLQLFNLLLMLFILGGDHFGELILEVLHQFSPESLNF
jgi:hypothetical protein